MDAYNGCTHSSASIVIDLRLDITLLTEEILHPSVTQAKKLRFRCVEMRKKSKLAKHRAFTIYQYIDFIICTLPLNGLCLELWRYISATLLLLLLTRHRC